MAAGNEDAPLAGLRILVVEDEYLVARNLRRTLRRAGASVAGPAPSASTAEAELAAAPVDVVLLDVALADGHAYPFADALIARGQPLAFLTGYQHDVLPPRFAATTWVGKPFSDRRIVQAVRTLLGGGGSQGVRPGGG